MADWTPPASDTITKDDLVRGILGQESGSGTADTSKPNASGANGPMQITRATFNGLKNQKLIPPDADFNNPEHTKAAGAVLVGQLYDQYGGDPEKVAAAYYGGPKAVGPDGKIVEFGDTKNPKAPTTTQYAQQVMGRIGGAPPWTPPDDEIVQEAAPEVPPSDNPSTPPSTPSFSMPSASDVADVARHPITSAAQAVSGHLGEIGAAFRGIGKGVTSGASVYGQAAANWLGNKAAGAFIPGYEGDGGGTWSQNLAQARQDNATEEAANPIASTAGQIGGGLIQGALSGGASIPGLAARGAVSGGVSGFSQNDDLRDAATGAGIGGVIGGIAGAIPAVGQAVVKRVGLKNLSSDVQVKTDILNTTISDARKAHPELKGMTNDEVIAHAGDRARAASASPTYGLGGMKIPPPKLSPALDDVNRAAGSKQFAIARAPGGAFDVTNPASSDYANWGIPGLLDEVKQYHLSNTIGGIGEQANTSSGALRGAVTAAIPGAIGGAAWAGIHGDNPLLGALQGASIIGGGHALGMPLLRSAIRNIMGLPAQPGVMDAVYRAASDFGKVAAAKVAVSRVPGAVSAAVIGRPSMSYEDYMKAFDAEPDPKKKAGIGDAFAASLRARQ